jgi:hypothetical protein
VYQRSGQRRIPDDVLPPLIYLSCMGENQWEEVRHFVPLPCWRTMQRARREAMKTLFPVDDPLDGSDNTLDAMVRLLPTIGAPFTAGRGAHDEYRLPCDALQTRPWVAVDRAGQIHGAIDANRGETVPPEDLAAVFADPSVFAELASRRAGEKRVANACFVFALISTAPGSPTMPVRLIRSSSGKANQEVAS